MAVKNVTPGSNSTLTEEMKYRNTEENVFANLSF